MLRIAQRASLRCQLPLGIKHTVVARILSTSTIHNLLDAVDPDIAKDISPIQAVPINSQPLLLPLSSLLVREPNTQRPSRSVISLAPSVFNHPIRRDILHACVVHYLDGLRQGTASTKTRAEVRGSGRKLRPQKGSGRARLGDKGNPMLRGGGVAFGPKPRDFSTQLPRKVREMGMRVALSARLREGYLSVVQTLNWPGFKTNELDKRIGQLGWMNTLFVSGLDSVPEGLERAGRNIQEMDSIRVQDLTVYEILKWRRVVLDLEAVEWLEQRLSSDG